MQDAPAASRLRELGERLDGAVAADPAGSLSAAVLYGGITVWTHATGWADRERGVRASPDTVYRIGSITKSFTVACALRLAERGVLDIDDRVADHVPEIVEVSGYATQRDAVSLRDLCSHTSGLAREPRIPNQLDGAVAVWDQTLVSVIPTARFAHPPRACFDYLNLGIAILGLALQRAVCRPYMDLIGEEIFQTLRLQATGFFPADRPSLAAGYERLVDGTISTDGADRQHLGRGYRVPGGGIYSTPLEIARFADALSPAAGDALLPLETRKELLRPVTHKSEESSPGPSNAYGLGVELYLSDSSILHDGSDLIAYAHHGDMTGYASVFLCDPRRRLALAVCSNFRGSEALGADESIELLRIL